MRNEYLDSAPLDTWLMIINKGVKLTDLLKFEFNIELEVEKP